MRRIRNWFGLLALASLLLAGPAPISAAALAPVGAPSQAAGQNGVSPAAYVKAHGRLRPPGQFNSSRDLTGLTVSLDPKLGPVSQPADAAYGTWAALAESGFNDQVFGLTAVGTDVYVGGIFTASSGGATAGLNRIARYDTQTGTWHALADNGLDYSVYAMAAVGTDLYVGGAFQQSHGGATTGLHSIARYDTTNGTWHALADNGLTSSSYVFALAVVGTDLYAVGTFSGSSGGATTGLNRIARYDTSNGTWHALADNGLDGTAYAVARVGSDLYVGGSFTQSFGGATTGLNRIARYDTSAGTWNALADNGLNGTPYALAKVGTNLYVAGLFFQSFGGATTGLRNIARYDTSGGTWHALADQGLNALADALTVVDSDLYVGGNFQQSYGGATTGLNDVARYDTSAGVWHALADGGLNANVLALAAAGTDLYVGGNFSQSFGGATTGLNMIAAYGLPSGGTFADVPFPGKEWMEPWIIAFYNHGITTGCGGGPLIYCPENNVTRAEMAVFVLRSRHGAGYTPPAASHFFLDVPVTGKEWMEPWIDEYYREGMTTGCGGGNYCPENNVTRAEMAVFVLRSLHGGGYTPPALSHFFSDMPVTGKEWMEPWVDEFKREGITTGCGGGNYCPENNVTRAEMAVFISRAYHFYP